MKIGQKIRELRLKSGLTQSDVAEKLNTSKQNIYKYETGIITNIPLEKIEALAKLLNVSPAELTGWEDNIDYEKYGIRTIKTKKFPMLGNIACGEPIYCNEEYETYVEASEDIKADFCLTAEGDSMINARIFDGDVVFIRQQPMVENGEIAAVIINDTATLKRVYIKSDRIILRPENPVYDDIVYEKEEMNDVRILGKAVAFQSAVR